MLILIHHQKVKGVGFSGAARVFGRTKIRTVDARESAVTSNIIAQGGEQGNCCYNLHLMRYRQ